MTTEPPEITKTQLTIHLGATLAVTTTASGWSDWIKPGASFSTTFNGIPTEEQLKLTTQFVQEQVLGPMMEEIVTSAQKRLIEARRGT